MFRAIVLLLSAALAPALAAAASAPVSRLEVRVVTGADAAERGGYAELRIQEEGRELRRIPLTRDDAWPAGSVRVVPVTLERPLDPDDVTRFGLYFRAETADAWEIRNAEVYALDGGSRVRLLDTGLRGTIRREGEISTFERAASARQCAVDADCDDGRSCNGVERCRPSAPGADARGCVAGPPVACPTNQVCVEGAGCRGVSTPGMAPVEPPDVGAQGGGFAAPLPTDGASANGAAGPAESPRPRATPVQRCSGAGVVLTTPDGSERQAACPSGTRCISQPNGTGICAPGG